MSRLSRLNSLFNNFRKFSNRGWYGFAIGFFAFIDNLILVIPTDGILISSAMINPKKWFRYVLFVTIGSTLGAVVLATVIEYQGIEFIQAYFPQILQNQFWELTEKIFVQYGLIVVFFVAVTPLAQQPAVVLAALAKVPIYELLIVILIGRFIKNFLMGYVGSHSPKYLKYLWGVQSEIKQTQDSSN